MVTQGLVRRRFLGTALGGALTLGSRADAGYRPEQLPQEADQDHRPAILSVSLLGSFAIRNLMADVVISLAFGLLGYVVIGVFIVSWIVSIAIYKLRRYDDINVKTL